jgi:O-acetyl-ADP-ribose deacetylase (regulator of RNase III)
MRSIAFPAVSTGIFGFPKDRCARIMLNTTKSFLENEQTSLEEVDFCLWSEEDLDVFKDILWSMVD